MGLSCTFAAPCKHGLTLNRDDAVDVRLAAALGHGADLQRAAVVGRESEGWHAKSRSACGLGRGKCTQRAAARVGCACNEPWCAWALAVDSVCNEPQCTWFRPWEVQTRARRAQTYNDVRLPSSLE